MEYANPSFELLNTDWDSQNLKEKFYWNIISS